MANKKLKYESYTDIDGFRIYETPFDDLGHTIEIRQSNDKDQWHVNLRDYGVEDSYHNSILQKESWDGYYNTFWYLKDAKEAVYKIVTEQITSES